MWTRLLTRPVSCTARLSTGDPAGARWLFRADAHTALFRSEDATPGSRACMRVRALLGLVGRVGLPGASLCASPFMWLVLLRSLFAWPPPGSGCPLNFFAPPLSLAFLVFQPGVPWSLACCCLPLPALFLFFFWSFFFVCPLFLWPLFLLFFLLCAPPMSLALRVTGPGVPWASAPCCPRPPFFSSPDPFSFFFACFSYVSCFSFFAFFLVPALPVVRCGGDLCVLGCGLCWCELQWCCPCRCSLCGALSPLWLWLVLCGVACCVWVFAVGPGCPLLSPGSSWSRVTVVLSLSGRVARRPVVWCGVFLCSAALCCVLWRSAVVWWCAVVLCCLFVSLPVPVVCFCRCASAVCVLGCRAVGSLSSSPCAVLCFAVLVPLRCAVRVVCAVSGAWCCWFLVSLPVFGGPLVALAAWRCRLVLCVGSSVRVWPCRPSFGVFLVVSYSPMLCPVALCCRVVLCFGPLSSFIFAFLMALVFCFPLKISCDTRKNGFLFLEIN